MGSNHIWVFLSNEEIEYLGEAVKTAITHNLGNNPISCINIEVSRKPGGEQLAVEFASFCMQKWNAIVLVPEERIYSQKDIDMLHKNNNGFKNI